MPIYEYRCAACQHVFEALVRRAADTPRCPACGRARLEKQFSTFSVAAPASASHKACDACPAAGDGCGGSACCGLGGEGSRRRGS
jgi:putative FmdB family regulatory protein